MMKPVRITIDEALLRAFDQDAQVRAKGRSAVLRRLLADYLSKNRKAAITQAYHRGYGKAGADELKGWTGEGAWRTD
ncbi:MAG TPA: ribbon-helix-helix domain-containing protein [Myxococcales bacterium]|jgi:metal-responsive CopG/Arc/MetJ family transcriptional regulator